VRFSFHCSAHLADNMNHRVDLRFQGPKKIGRLSHSILLGSPPESRRGLIG
jgi:hypothetical protein